MIVKTKFEKGDKIYLSKTKYTNKHEPCIFKGVITNIYVNAKPEVPRISYIIAADQECNPGNYPDTVHFKVSEDEFGITFFKSPNELIEKLLTDYSAPSPRTEEF